MKLIVYCVRHIGEFESGEYYSFDIPEFPIEKQWEIVAEEMCDNFCLFESCHEDEKNEIIKKVVDDGEIGLDLLGEEFYIQIISFDILPESLISEMKKIPSLRYIL